FLVKQRTREIGVRMALGAKQSSIMALILGQGGRLLAVGVAAGLGAGFALERGVAPLVYGGAGKGPRTLLGAGRGVSVGGADAGGVLHPGAAGEFDRSADCPEGRVISHPFALHLLCEHSAPFAGL